MKIELKKVQIYNKLSEETTAFTADIYVNGVKAGYAKNDGCGGSTLSRAYEGKRSLIEEAEEYCLSLPPIKYTNIEIPMDLEHFIDNIIDEIIQAKENAKFNKRMSMDMRKGLLVKTEKGYSLISWKGCNLAFMLTKHKDIVVNTINKLKREGKTILNTNIPDLV